MSDRDEKRSSDSTRDTHVTQYTANERPSEMIVRAVAAVSGVEPTELDLVYDSIDPDALDTLLGSPPIGDNGGITVEFMAAGYQVTVRNDGTICILDGQNVSSGDGES